MQKKLRFAAAVSAVCISLISCDSNDSKTFSSKSDSLAFAKAVMDQYPEERAGRSVRDTTNPVSDPKPSDGFSPISWATVEAYSKNYDADACLKSPIGQYYQGFSIDTAGYNRLKRTLSIKGLYLRLGKKADGSYTIMVLGTDSNGNIINTGITSMAPLDSTNFDNVRTCPDFCPE